MTTATATCAAIAASAVTKRFGRREALRGAGLEARPGEVVAINGTSPGLQQTLAHLAVPAVAYFALARFS